MMLVLTLMMMVMVMMLVMMIMMIADYHLSARRISTSATSTISKANQHEICFNQDRDTML
jgi:hypothetical protein